MPQSVDLLPGPPTHYCQARDNSGITDHTTKGQPSRQGKSRTHIIKWPKNKNNYIFLYCNHKRHNIDYIYSYSRALLTLQSLNALRRRHGVILSAFSPPSGGRDRNGNSLKWKFKAENYPLTILGVMFTLQSSEILYIFLSSLLHAQCVLVHWKVLCRECVANKHLYSWIVVEQENKSLHP